jgi:hypothetical protein
MPEQCAQKTALLLEYTRLTKAYSDVVTELHTAIGTISKSEYNGQYQVADEARLEAEKARAAMESHIRDHRC